MRTLFAHSSGIHQDGIIKSRVTFEIIDPKEIGWKESQLILSPRSGRNALRHRLSELGYEVEAEQLDKVYERFLKVADKKKAVQDADLEAIMSDEKFARSLPFLNSIIFKSSVERKFHRQQQSVFERRVRLLKERLLETDPLMRRLRRLVKSLTSN